MRIAKRWIAGPGFELRRTTGGVMEIRGRTELDLARGIGFAHAHDRQVQMMLVRLIGQGRLGACLRADAEALAIDTFSRQVGFARHLDEDEAALAEATRASAEAYCEGVNHYLREHGRPLELVLAGYRPEPWTVADCVLTTRIISYVGLAQSQGDLEKLICEALAGGVDAAQLRALFHPYLEHVDDERLQVLPRVQPFDATLPEGVRFAAVIPRMVASNNWAVAAGRSRSGHALQCNDPHLEVNRLPAIWYEWIGHCDDDDHVGIGVPGTPGVVMGRNRHVSRGLTYGFMDQIDYFVEEIEDGRCRRGSGWEAVQAFTETIERKGADPVVLTIRETSHGVLEADPRRPLADGFYLCRAYVGRAVGAAKSMNAALELMGARDVDASMNAARHMGMSANWLFADRNGRIAYQQSGLLPRRLDLGLVPRLGWRADEAWDGTVDPDELVHEVDPPDGVLVTANEDRNRPGFPRAITACMGPYRADRIRALLAARHQLDLDDMKRVQADLVSNQAVAFMALFRPHLPPTEAGATLGAWDCRYDVESHGAVLFERAYAAVCRDVFGRGVFGLEAWDLLMMRTPVVADFYKFFDDALLGDDPRWWGDEGRDGALRRVLAQALRHGSDERWGERNRFVMTNLFFGGALPKWLGFDVGPLPLPGGRATVVQGSLFEAGGRSTSFAPSWRYVADLGEATVHTALPGGPSGNRFSPHYLADVERWQSFAYKSLAWTPDAEG